MKVGIITSIIGIIITVIVIMTFIGGTSDTMTDASDTLEGSGDNCSDDTSSDADGVALVYNHSDGYCYNSSTNALYLASQNDLPLESLFSSSGVVWIAFMAFLLMVVVGVAIKFKK